MVKLWGIHNDQPSINLLDGGFVSIGWEELGDLTEMIGDREAMKERLAATYPAVKVGAIPGWAGSIDRFTNEMQDGDIVICPNKADSTINFGRVAGPYYYVAGEDLHPNRRPVEWLRTGVPRADFSQTARNEIGSALTIFGVRRHAKEFLAFLGSDSGSGSHEDVATGPAEEDHPTFHSAEQVATATRDFVIDILRAMDPYQFEHLTAGLLTALGYRATPTSASADGGVDVIAHRDPLGLEPPIIKVQCKRTTSTVGGPVVQGLIGSLASGASEVGLFVTLGAYSSDALHIERTRHDLKLLNGKQFVDLLLQHYEDLAPEWKQLLPLRRVYAVDGDSAAT